MFLIVDVFWFLSFWILSLSDPSLFHAAGINYTEDIQSFDQEQKV